MTKDAIDAAETENREEDAREAAENTLSQIGPKPRRLSLIHI